MVPNQRHSSGRSKQREDLSQRAKGTNSKSNPQAERLLIASFIKSATSFYEFASYINDTDFSIPDYSLVFHIINHFYSNTSNSESITLTQFEATANAIGFSSACNDFVRELFDVYIGNQENISDYFYQVKKEAIRRLYTNKLFEIHDYLDNTTDSATNVISNVEELVMNVSDNLQGESKDIYNLTENAKEIIFKLAKNPGSNGLDVGLPVWQNYIGDLSNGTVHMIIANMKTGKSQIGMHVGMHVASQYNLPVLYCDSEMNKEQQTIRAFGMYMKIPYWILRKGYWELSDEKLIEIGFIEGSNELRQIQQARMYINDNECWESFRKIPLKYLSINGLSVGDAIPLMRKWINRHTNIDKNSLVPQALIIYDYIKLPSFDAAAGKLQEYQLLGLYAGQLHDFFHKYNLPCLTFGQTNSEIDRSFRSIAASKRLGQLVDSLSIMFRKNPEERVIVPEGSHGLDVIVTRDGTSTNEDSAYINFNFDRTMGQVEELGYVDGRQHS